jgi:hypothetical protein
MKTRLQHISPASIAAFLASITFVFSILAVIFVIAMPMKEGVTFTLSGFMTTTFHGHVNYGILAIYPVINTISAMVCGFTLAWIYNFWAHFSGGIGIRISDIGPTGRPAIGNKLDLL